VPACYEKNGEKRVKNGDSQKIRQKFGNLVVVGGIEGGKRKLGKRSPGVNDFSRELNYFTSLTI
jgi:hypothetical protein